MILKIWIKNFVGKIQVQVKGKEVAKRAGKIIRRSNVNVNDFMDRFEAVTKKEAVQMPIVYILTRDIIVDVLNFDINVIKEYIESDKIAIQSDIKWEKLNNFELELIAAC